MKRIPHSSISNIFYLPLFLWICILLGCCVLLLVVAVRGDTQRWWKLGTDGETFSFLPQKNTIYFANNSGSLYALNKRNGKMRWQFKTDHPIFSYPIVYKSTAIVASKNGVLYGVSTSNGNEKWRFENPDHLSFTQTVSVHSYILLADASGSVYAINADTGKQQWRYKTKSHRAVTTSTAGDVSVFPFNNITASKTAAYYIGMDGVVYALNIQSGALLWTFDSRSTILFQPILKDKLLFLTMTNGVTIALNETTGLIKWRRADLSGQSNCLSLFGLQKTLAQSVDMYPKKFLQTLLYIFQHNILHIALDVRDNGTITIMNPKNGMTLLTIHTDLGATIGCPSLYGPKIYIGGKNKLSVFDIFKGYSYWTYVSAGSNFSFPNVYGFTNIPMLPLAWKSFYMYMLKPVSIYIADDTDNLSSLSEKGREVWKFSATSKINQYTHVEGTSIYFSGTDGGFYRLNRNTGKPQMPKQRFTVEQQILRSGTSNILEITVRGPDDILENPWRDMALYADYVHSTNRRYTVKGFYYDKNTWKLRFNPPIKGNWTWKVTLDANGNKTIFTGSHLSLTDTKHVFLHIDQANQKRLTIDNKTIFNGVGIGDIIADRNNNGYPLDDWFIGDTISKKSNSSSDSATVNLKTYLSAYGSQGKFNMYRWSVNNWSFNLWNSFTLNNKMLVSEGKYGDELAQNLRKHNFQIWMTMFGFQIPFSSQYTNELKEMSRYIEYIVARYGPYVSVWEISNEAYAPESLIRYIANEIKRLDYENRPISVSHVMPDMNEISIISPHWYETESLSDSDNKTIYEISKYSSFSKPIVFGEQGNFTPDSTLVSGVRMRVRAWTAYFNEAILIFWNQSENRSVTTSQYTNANLYIGEGERKYIAALQDFTNGVSLSAKPSKLNQDNSAVRSYGLASDAELLGYFYHYTQQSEKTSFRLTLNLQKEATLYWFDPSSGKNISEETVKAGTLNLMAPEFTLDIALKILYK